MNLLYLPSYLLNHQILTWKDLGKQKIYLLIQEEVLDKTKQLKSRASIGDICIINNIDGKYLHKHFKI